MNVKNTKELLKLGGLPLLLCLLLVGAVFFRNYGFEFVSWDDDVHLLKNPLLIDQSHSLTDFFLTRHLGYPMPITLLSYKLEIALFGLQSAGPFHVTNLLIHLSSCLLVFLIGLRLGLSRQAALLALFVFGLHPAVAEPVSWVSGRKDLLAALFSLLCLWTHLNKPFEWKNPRSWWSLLFFVLAIFSKPVSAFLVLLLPICSRLIERQTWKSSVLTVIPMGLIVSVVFPIALSGQSKMSTLREDHGFLMVLREAWYALGFHLRLASLVEAPCVKHFATSWPPAFEAVVDLMPVLFIGLFAAAWFLVSSKKRPILLIAIAWSALSYLPSSSLIPLKRFLADVYIYLPLAGLGWVLGLLLDELESRIPIRSSVHAAIIATLGITFATMSFASSGRWQSSFELWHHGSLKYPNEYRICRNLGNAMMAKAEASKDLKRFEWRGAAVKQYEQCAKQFGQRDFQKNIAVALFFWGVEGAGTEALLKSQAIFRQLEKKQPNSLVAIKYLERIDKALASQP